MDHAQRELWAGVKKLEGERWQVHCEKIDAALQAALEPTPPPRREVRDPEPVETPAERRARWLALFDEEEKLEKRGALQRLSDRERVDRSNMAKAIAKARSERDEQKRTGIWTSQMVKDGKR
jgi:hypothetical protein